MCSSPPGEEIAVRVSNRGLYLLDAELNQLAWWPGDKLDYDPYAEFWRAGPDHLYLMGHTNKKGILQLVAAPWAERLKPAPLITAGAYLLILGGWRVLRRRRTTPRAPKGSKEHLRQVRLQLLQELEQGGHGALAHLKALRRLNWILEARLSGLGGSEELDARMRSLVTEVHGSVLPVMRGLTDHALFLQVESPDMASIRDQIDVVDHLVLSIKQAGFSQEAIQAAFSDLRSRTNALEAGFKLLRRNVEEEFRTDLALVFQRVLEAHAQTAEGKRARIGVQGQSWPCDLSRLTTSCRIDSEELAFVLDNLVENALRAMAESQSPELDIRWRSEAGLVTVTITDCGWGIDPEDWGPNHEPRFQCKGRRWPGAFSVSGLVTQVRWEARSRGQCPWPGHNHETGPAFSGIPRCLMTPPWPNATGWRP
jgi:signal transduction histidine kinase